MGAYYSPRKTCTQESRFRRACECKRALITQGSVVQIRAQQPILSSTSELSDPDLAPIDTKINCFLLSHCIDPCGADGERDDCVFRSALDQKNAFPDARQPRLQLLCHDEENNLLGQLVADWYLPLLVDANFQCISLATWPYLRVFYATLALCQLRNWHAPGRNF